MHDGMNIAIFSDTILIFFLAQYQRKLFIWTFRSMLFAFCSTIAKTLILPGHCL